MTTYGVPETCTRRCGDEIARLRTQRNWSRAKLVARLYDELDQDDPNYDAISESWLKRLESGVKVKLPRQTLEALCRALRCTARERARLLLYADRSILTMGDAVPSRAAEALNYTMVCLYAEVHDILDDLMSQPRAEDLDEDEIIELISTALAMVVKQRQKRNRL